MKVDMKRGAFSKDVSKSIEFIVEATRQVESGKEVRGGPFWGVYASVLFSEGGSLLAARFCV